MNDFFTKKTQSNGILRDNFIEPPFSVLDTRSGSWQSRKKEWKKLGIKSELGRLDDLTYKSDKTTTENLNYYRNRKRGAIHSEIHRFDGQNNSDDVSKLSTSIFDPVLCELMYKWFCMDKGSILDPFAGGSVRGIIAHYLNYKYTGIELREEQVKANYDNAKEILSDDNIPCWIQGDSEIKLDELKDNYDFIFSCPPYMDLEIYSKDENDLSNMNDEDFIKKYENIIFKSCSYLNKDCYACFVIGDVRDKKTGFYKDFITITKTAFYKAGLKLYNDAVLLNVVASASMRAGKVFSSGKKLTKIHQNILIFKKI